MKIKKEGAVLIAIFLIAISFIISFNLVFAEEIDCGEITREYIKELKIEQDTAQLEIILLQCKEGRYAQIREDATWALGYIKDPRTVSALLGALKDESEEVREAATWALGEVKDPRTVPALLGALKDESGKVRGAAAWALGKTKDLRTIPALIEALKDKDWYVSVEATKALGEIPEAVPALIEALKDESEKVRHGAVLALEDIKDPRAIPALIEVLKRDKDYYVRKGAAGALGYMLQDPRAVLALIEALKDESEKVRTEAAWALENYDLKPLSIEFKREIAAQVSNTINAIYAELEDRENLTSSSQLYAVLINKLHDNDDGRDLVRTGISKHLAFRSKYFLISLGGADLYTSSFFNIWNEMIKDPDYLSKIEAIDSNKEYAVDFILTLSGFGVLKGIIKESPDYFLPSLEQALEDKENIIRNGGLLTSTITSILRTEDPGLGGTNEKIQDLLLNLYVDYRGKKFLGRFLGGFPEGRGVIGYQIKLNKEYFKNIEKAEEISKELPEILEPYVPQEWLDDNKITVKMYFYPDEAWFGLARNYYANQIGIKEITSEEDEIVIKLKPRNGVKIRKEFYRKGIAIDVKKHVAIIKLKRGEYIDLEITEEGKKFINKGLTLYADSTTTIKKEMSGVEINLILTLNNDDVEEVLEDPTIDIMAHRGHSFHDRETFPRITADCNKKLIYIGSCGSFRTVPYLQETYDHAYYMSDQDIGRGNDNNLLLEYLPAAIASGEKDWNKIKAILEEKVKATGIVYPADKDMLIYDFVKRVKAKAEESA